MDLHSSFAIEHPSGQHVLVSKAVDKRAEANTLHQAAHTN